MKSLLYVGYKAKNLLFEYFINFALRQIFTGEIR